MGTPHPPPIGSFDDHSDISESMQGGVILRIQLLSRLILCSYESLDWIQ